ncbi:4'-phosphopantetheinyl transferase family protein [Kitasatospora mediocidica]|uniref:4'-phosphopantetheinyl transferase family protein n=1 Tax=Kitasatospora mediocidica TaxID=58352 RepID=UPI00056B4882|nr:4'-phosphopantetheinyl transferase superfamily protein [Kitasatospora mediocidica]
MIDELIPAAACAYSFEDFGEDGLFPQEVALLAGLPDDRRRESATVRACARQALTELGLPPTPVLPGVRNAPQWPAGVVGSMTHCDGYRAAALARDSRLLAVGIDAEPDAPLPSGVLESIALPSEAAWAAAAPGGGGLPHRGRLLFSAKESVYKTWYPLMRTELEFEDAEIRFTQDPPAAGVAGRSGTFHARVLRPGRHSDGRLVSRFDGGWVARHGLIVTAIAVAA